MDAEERTHLEAVRSEKLKRLRVLELHAAKAGYTTDPAIVIEIDDLRKEIAEIEHKLEINQQPQSWAEYGRLELVKITLPGDFASLTPEIKAAAIRAFAAVVNIPPERIVVLAVTSGSIVFRLLMPSFAVRQLVELYTSENPLIGELEIVEVRRLDLVDSEQAGLNGVNLSGVDLRNADLRWINLSELTLRGANLRGVDFRWANLSRVDLRGADLSSGKAFNVRVGSSSWSHVTAFPHGAIIRGTILRNADISDTDLRGADLSGADLSDADLSGSDLRGVDFRGADLSGANLSGANLSGADLSGADLSGADLVQADLSGADLSGADLIQTNLSLANLSGAIMPDGSKH